ncbi:Uncharacterised protein [Serratia fonticola]|uniref:Uncharacterized protein n=1 Tax=Serratia fonticola TaxID=47917 RepID=A0A4U9V5G2_SERFO|nr:Uncharacterised protein [Serratia fonticola]
MFGLFKREYQDYFTIFAVNVPQHNAINRPYRSHNLLPNHVNSVNYFKLW